MLTVFATVTTGVLVLVAGRILQTFTLDPVNELRKVIGEVEFNLFYYANIYANLMTHEEVHRDGFPVKTREKIDKAEETFRQLGARLSAASAAIVWYGLWEYTPWIPCAAAVGEATRELTLLSNSMYRPDRDTPIPREERNAATADRIRALLLLDGRSRPFRSHFRRVFRLRRAASHAETLPTSDRSSDSV
jgi:hypothetical protein